jgi:hypothetical protein
MAHTVTVTPLMAGSSRSIFLIGLESDGVSGELTNEILINPCLLGLNSKARLVIEGIEYNFADFDARLLFDSGFPAKRLAWTMHSQLSTNDFNPYGGIKDQSDIDGNGNILITTNGFGSAGVVGSLIIKIRNA